MLLRALILLLLCMNIGVAVWWAKHHEAVPVALPATEVGVASLTLLSEAPRPPAALADVEELSADPEQLNSQTVCLSLGPFASSAALRRAMNTLLPQVERIQFREVPALAVQGYRVFLPPAGSRAEAQEIARGLAAKGIADYYVVTAGEQQNTISLGLFRDLANASKRHDEVAALGYNPIVEARTESAPQWWIDLAAPAGFDWQALLPGSEVQAKATPCG
jgi:hypothetical protein